eukprot:TRINITY_DN61241_c0_g1_i1.p1 TRINITY_DN61241_c0_g1~~TRINITY_DN61241_c0_g1_i1.p1  ORF type:complete len:583 (-),score=101.02 TRINITY_DN61241_c0_g1_i1:264-2012(-)
MALEHVPTVFSAARRILKVAWGLLRRGFELVRLYLPLLPLLLLAILLDRFFPRHRPQSNPSTKDGGTTVGTANVAQTGARSWKELWWDEALRRIQRSGPVFVKLGQWAATRRDLFSEECCAALGSLHDGTDAHSLEHTHKVLARAFPAFPWYNSLLIEPKPVGSGCIAQVYVGYLLRHEKESIRAPGCFVGMCPLMGRRPGDCKRASSSRSSPVAGKNELVGARKVAVKVVHPQVQRAIDLDLSVLVLAARLCERLGLDHLGFSLALRQFASFLATQIDLRVEAENLVRLRACFGRGSLDVVVPEVFPEWVSREALVMSFEEGEALSTLIQDSSDDSKARKRDAWRTMCDAFWSMVFKHRFVHGDLHPGNVLWRRRPEGGSRVQLVFLDCGLVLDLSGAAGEDLTKMVRAFLTKTPEEVARLLIPLSERVGGRPEDVIDADGFVRGIASLIREAAECNFCLSKLNVGPLVGKSLLLGRRHRVRFDARFVNLAVAAVVMQGVVMGLHRDGDMLSRVRYHLLGAAAKQLGAGLAGSFTGGAARGGSNLRGSQRGEDKRAAAPSDLDALGFSAGAKLMGVATASS